MSELFTDTARPDRSLFYRGTDPAESKMGDIVRSDEKDYDTAEVVIVGCPQDYGVKRNHGRAGARKAPEFIRRALYRFPVPPGISRKEIFDLGDIEIESSLESTHEKHYRVIRKLLSDGKRIISLGGGNDISYPDCRALSESSEDLVAFNIDSHFDVRASDAPHSGTPYRQLLDETLIKPENFYELAGKQIANSPEYHRYLEDLGVNIFSLRDMRREGSSTLVKSILNGSPGDAIFWGFDIDSVRSPDAPGASAPYPEGLSAEEINEIAGLAGTDKRTGIIEITEVNPDYDIDGRTGKLAAMIIMNYLWKTYDTVI